jgi:carboxyl-terminal processing protease
MSWPMKNLLLTLALLLCGTFVFSQPVRNFKQEAYHVRNILRDKHVSPRSFDDDFSRDVFDLILEKLDAKKILFTRGDIVWLEHHQTLIDDEINGQNWTFLSRLSERYGSVLKRAKINITEIMKEDMGFDKKLTFDESPADWELDDDKLKNRQRLYLKQQVLDKLAALGTKYSLNCDETIAKRKNDAIEQVRKNELRNIDNLISAEESLINFVGRAYFHAVTHVFDPHTEYLSPTDMKSFIGKLATEDYYFGFTLEENPNGEIVISALSAGGPAWKSGELHVSDVLLAIKPPAGEAIEVADLNFEEVNEVLDEINDYVLDFTVRKSNGVQKTVRLAKERMSNEENFVRSFVLQGEEKFGYIHLPDFYTQWGSQSESSRCANDVAREIIKLKRDGIQGLILDLRFNGGGSLEEALAMAGIFIDEGPLAIERQRDKTSTLKDIYRGTVYDGPLVVMVNGRSASASELVAAAIQDYNRGVIVGSQTYGKATGQAILPINPVKKGNSLHEVIDNTNGFVKITMEKLYRVTGKTLQGSGITPDIHLPDVFDVLNYHERDIPFSLIADSVPKNSYYKPLPVLNRTVLRNKSEDRRLQTSAFAAVDDLLKFIEDSDIHSDVFTLSLDDLCKRMEAGRRQRSEDEKDLKDRSPFVVKNNSTEEQRLIVDTYADTYNKLWFQKLQNDLFVHETYWILRDMLTLKNP